MAFPGIASGVDLFPAAAKTGVHVFLRHPDGHTAIAVHRDFDHDGHLIDIAAGICCIGRGAVGLRDRLWRTVLLLPVVVGLLILDLRGGAGGDCKEAEEEDELFHDDSNLMNSL